MYLFLAILTSITSITRDDLHNLFKQNQCCPITENPCCEIEFEGLLYQADVIRSVYSSDCEFDFENCHDCTRHSQMCIDAMQTMNITVQVQNNDTYVVPPITSIYPNTIYAFNHPNLTVRLDNDEIFDGIVPLNYNGNIVLEANGRELQIHVIYTPKEEVRAKLNWDVLDDHIRINVSISNIRSKYSAFKFHYASDLILSGDIQESSDNFQTVMHNSSQKIIVAILKPRQSQLSGPAIYLPFQHFTFFEITEELVTTDEFPVTQYPSLG